jgi:hypothetical protein
MAFGDHDDRSARIREAMWMKTIRASLERSIPAPTDGRFDDLLARLDRIPGIADRRRDAPAAREAGDRLARRDAALEARLSGYVDLMAGMLRGRARSGCAAC